MSPRIPFLAALFTLVAPGVLHAQANRPNATPQPTAATTRAALEADAARSAQLQARRYAIWAARLDSGRLTDQDKAELDEIARAVRAIEAKYEGRGMLELSVDLRNLTREQVIARAGPAWNRVLLERFPLPDRVRSDFPDPLRGAAALEVLYSEFALGRTLRPPRTRELDARDAAYRSAIQAIIATQAPDGETSPAAKAFAEGALRLSGTAAFKREVLGRYLPLFASWVRDEPAPFHAAAAEVAGLDAWIFRPIGTMSGQPIFLGHAALPVTALFALLGGLVIPLRRARARGRRHNAARAPGTGTADRVTDLPVELQVLDLSGRMYPELTATSGVVLEKEGWTETTSTYSSTGPSQHHGATSSVTTTTTKKDRLWVRTTTGDEQPWTITGDVFQARPGHPVTWVAARLREDPQTVCMVFNHATGRFYEKPWVALAHRGAIGTFILTLLWILSCCAVMAYLEWRLFQTTYLFQLPALGGVVLLALWVPIARVLVRHPRQRVWETRYRPRLLEWLKLVGPALPASVAGGPPPVSRAR